MNVFLVFLVNFGWMDDFWYLLEVMNVICGGVCFNFSVLLMNKFICFVLDLFKRV